MKRTLAFWSGPASLLTVLIGVLAYATSIYPALKTVVWPTDSLRILAFRYSGTFVVHNAGDREVYVVQFELREAESFGTQGKTVFRRIAPGDFLRVKSKTPHRPSKWMTIGFGDKSSQENFARVIKEARRNPCVDVDIFSIDDPMFSGIAEYHQRRGTPLLTLPVDGRLEYEVAGKTERRILPFEAVGVLRVFDDCPQSTAPK